MFSLLWDAAAFLATLPGVLREGLAQEKLVALRRCVDRVWVDAGKGTLRLAVRVVPTAATAAMGEIAVSGITIT